MTFSITLYEDDSVIVRKFGSITTTTISTWFCGYTKVEPTNQLRRIAAETDESLDDVINQMMPPYLIQMTRGITFASGLYIGFDTNHTDMEKITETDIINICKGIQGWIASFN